MYTETPSPLESLVESRLDTRSPVSEKSFISVNCSRYVTDIGVESEPSDAETITSGSDDNDSDDDNNGSWEEERTGSTQSASEEEDDAGRGADWYMSEPGSQQASELSPEEEGKWLSLNRQEYLSRRQRRGYHTDRQHEHGHGQTRASHHNVRHESAEKRMGAHSAEPSFAHHRAHTSLMSGSRHGMFLQSTGHQTHRGGPARRTLQSSSSTPSPLKDRVGLPRRVVPVQLFQQEEESKTQSSDGSVKVVTDEFSEDSTHDKEPSRELLSSSSLSDAGDEVDSSFLAGPQKGLIHPGIQPIVSRAPASQKDSFFERRGNYALTGMTATQCHTRAQETGAALNEGSTTSADTRSTAGLLQGSRYNVPFHLQTFDTTYTVSPQSSPKRTVFDSTDMFLMSYCEKSTSKTSSPSKERLMAKAPSEGLYHYRRVPLQSEQDTRNTGDVEAELSNQNSLIKRANDVEIGPGHDSEPLRQQRSSVITAGKKNVPEVRTGKALPHDSSLRSAEDILPPTGNGYKASTDMTTSGIGSQSSTMILLTPNKSDSPFKPSHGSVEMSPLVEIQKKLEILAKNITPRKASSASCTPSNAEKDCNNARGDKTYCFGTSDGGDKNDHGNRTPAKLVPSDPIKANFSSPCKPVSSANTSFVPFTSPLPLVKIESPQQWLEVKRRFRPTCKPISAQEIKQVLEMPNATSVLTFLKQKYCKTEPSSPCHEENSNAFLQSAVQSETVNVRPSIFTRQSSFTTNGKVLAFTEERSTVRIPTELVDPKSTQVNQESSTVRRSSTPKSNRKAIPLSGISSPDSTPHRGEGGSQLFRASPAFTIFSGTRIPDFATVPIRSTPASKLVTGFIAR
ncbi:uncharacterized protein [Littorina saxatilis]|uniref:uncharacterized protein n=1 Tax=Littorina saxatilis TaxID=31220 RepID=UPI0038B50619